MGKLILVEETTPATPPSGSQTIFIDSADGMVKKVDDDGTVTPLGAYTPPGMPIVRGPWTFSHDASNLNEGIEFYFPTVDDVLLDAWVEIDTAWDGTTPLLDIGSGIVQTTGLFGVLSTGLDMTVADEEAGGTGYLLGSGPPSSLVSASGAHAKRGAPGRFTTGDPLKVWVSQDGMINGADPGSSVGSASLYIVTATPTTAGLNL